MGPDMIPLLRGGAVMETIVDRRTGNSWSVSIEPFELASSVITCAQWDEVHGVEGDPSSAGLPKVDVSWREAVVFCNALSVLEGLEPVYEISRRDVPATPSWQAHSEPEIDDWIVSSNLASTGYRLPTDAEWQVACRAGTAAARYGQLDDIAWSAANSGGQVHRVRTKAPNAWGLYDMLGNVWEWCWDLYDPAVYGPYRVIRGGGWSDPEWSCRSGVRRKTSPTAQFDDLGFRVARSPGA